MVTMLELSLSAFAWAGVMLFQAIVHYTIRTQKRLNGGGGNVLDFDSDQEPPALEASPLVLDELAASRTIVVDDQHGGPSVPESQVSEAQVAGGDMFQDEIDPLDGDEPPVFFELLSQTGCEMMRNVSIESIVLEQLNEGDRSARASRLCVSASA